MDFHHSVPLHALKVDGAADEYSEHLLYYTLFSEYLEKIFLL